MGMAWTVSETIGAAVHHTCWRLDAEQPDRSELAQSRWQRTIPVAMDPAMSSERSVRASELEYKERISCKLQRSENQKLSM